MGQPKLAVMSEYKKKMSERIFEYIRNTETRTNEYSNILWFIFPNIWLRQFCCQNCSYWNPGHFSSKEKTLLPRLLCIMSLPISRKIQMMMKKSLTMMTVRQSVMLIMKIQTYNMKRRMIYICNIHVITKFFVINLVI